MEAGALGQINEQQALIPIHEGVACGMCDTGEPIIGTLFQCEQCIFPARDLCSLHVLQHPTSHVLRCFQQEQARLLLLLQ